MAALALAVGGLSGCGRAPAPSDGWQEGVHRWFEAEAIAGVSETGQPMATLTVAVPYRNLVFFHEDGRYVSRYVLRVEQGATQPPLAAREWRDEVVVGSFSATRDSRVERKTVLVNLLEELVQTGDPVPLEVSMLVEGTQRGGTVALSVRPGQTETGRRTLGDLTFYRLRDPLHPLTAEAIEVRPGRMPDVERFSRVQTPIYDQSTGPPWLLLRVFDLTGDTLQTRHEITLAVESTDGTEEYWSRSVELHRQGVESSVLVLVPAEALPFGRSRIRVSLEGGTSRRAVVDNLGLDLSEDRSWGVNLQLLQDVATPEELARLEETPPEMRARRWREFWARRDPDPDAPDGSRLAEHLRRVAYARTAFEDGFADGALSDRGRIYVLHGEPDVRETTSPYPDVPDTYEVWRYFDLGVAYFFRQDVGGAYRLSGREQI